MVSPKKSSYAVAIIVPYFSCVLGKTLTHPGYHPPREPDAPNYCHTTEKKSKNKKIQRSVTMEILDMAITMLPILHYLEKRGVSSFHTCLFDPNLEQVYIGADLFVQCFPDTVPDERGFAYATYNGVKFSTYFVQGEKK